MTADTEMFDNVCATPASAEFDVRQFCSVRIRFDRMDLLNVPSHLEHSLTTLVTTKQIRNQGTACAIDFKSLKNSTIGSLLCGVCSVFLSNGYNFVTSTHMLQTECTAFVFRRSTALADDIPPLHATAMSILWDDGYLHFTNAPAQFVAEFVAAVPALLKNKQVVCKRTTTDVSCGRTTLDYSHLFDSKSITAADMVTLWPSIIEQLSRHGYSYQARWNCHYETCAVFVRSSADVAELFSGAAAASSVVPVVECAATAYARWYDTMLVSGSGRGRLVEALARRCNELNKKVQKTTDDAVAMTTDVKFKGNPFFPPHNDLSDHIQCVLAYVEYTIAMLKEAAAGGFGVAHVVPNRNGQDAITFARGPSSLQTSCCAIIRGNKDICMVEDPTNAAGARAVFNDWAKGCGYSDVAAVVTGHYGTKAPGFHMKSAVFNGYAKSGILAGADYAECHRVCLSLIACMYSHGWRLLAATQHIMEQKGVMIQWPDTWYFAK